MKVSKYAKAVVAGLGPVVLAAQAAVTDGVISNAEWVTIGVAVAVAAGVVAVPNASKPATDRLPPL